MEKFNITDINERDLKVFLNNPVWLLLSQEIKERSEILAQDLKVAPKESTLKYDDTTFIMSVPGVEILQGQIKTMDWLMEIIQVIELQTKGGSDA